MDCRLVIQSTGAIDYAPAVTLGTSWTGVMLVARKKQLILLCDGKRICSLHRRIFLENFGDVFGQIMFESSVLTF